MTVNVILRFATEIICQVQNLNNIKTMSQLSFMGEV